MCLAPLHGGMGEQRYVTHKVEANNPALRKIRAPQRAWGGASGAPGYLLWPPRHRGRKGWCGRYVSFAPYLTLPFADIEYAKEEG